MGYRVGLQCFDTYESALDYKVSQITPVITSDGRLIAPLKQNETWYIGESQIKLDFPECSAYEQIKDGVQVGSGFLTLLAIVFVFRIVVGMIKDMVKPQ